MILMGAFAGAVGSLYLHNPWLGLLCAGLGGLSLALIHVLASVMLGVDQVVCGTALNILAAGVTTFGARLIFRGNTNLAGMNPIRIPLLGSIPVLGDIFFNQTIFTYLLFLLIPITWFIFKKTNWGIRMRAVGDNPVAADSQGISVFGIRMKAVCTTGFLAGLAGAYLSLGQMNMFQEGMSGGRGFIALAIIIVGKWRPGIAALVAFFFGTIEAFSYAVQAINSSLPIAVPYQLLLMLPYVFTVIVYILFSKRANSPSALGKPFIKV